MLELADIIAPVAPPPAPLPYGLIALGLTLLIVLIAGLAWFWLKRTRARRAALSQLQRLDRALRQRRLDPRDAAFQTGTALTLALPRKRGPMLDSARRDDAVEGPWRAFIAELDHARYASPAPDAAQAHHLVKQARHWVRKTC